MWRMAGLKFISNKSVKFLSAGQVKYAVHTTARAEKGLIFFWECMSWDFSGNCEKSFNIAEKH